MDDQIKKARAVERVLFAILLVALFAAGIFYELYRDILPTSKLLGLIFGWMCVAYALYRFALNRVLRKLGF